MQENDKALQSFLIESDENLGQLEQDIVALERSPRDNDRIASAFRAIHTIKGTCGFFGFSHLETLSHALEDLLGAMRDGDPETWEKRLTEADVPCATVKGIDEVAEHPQVAARDLLQEVDSAHGPLRLVGPGFKLAHGSGAIDSAPPQVGEHSDEILAEAGFSAEDIAGWRAGGVVA